MDTTEQLLKFLSDRIKALELENERLQNFINLLLINING
jgi:hypothetical protein